MGRRSIYLILAFLAGMRGEGQGDSLSESVLPLFNMVGVQDYGGGTLRSLDLWQEVETGERWLAFVRHREDLYRKYVGGVRVADLDKRAGTLVLFFSQGAKRQRQAVKLLFSRNVFEYEGRSRDRGWMGRLRTVDWSARIEYVLERDRYRARVGVARSRSRGRDQRFELEEFHRSSTDQRMNEFFWDLLEPTFGEKIDYTWKDRSWELEAGWRVDLALRGQLGLTAHWRDQRPAVDVRYLNSGSRAELRGLRRSALQQALSSWRYALAYQRPFGSAWRLYGEWGYSRREMHLRAQQQDRPQSASGVLLDLLELGNGWGDGKGVDGKIRGSWQSPVRLHIEAVLGWGRSTYQLRGEGSTPVLGFRLRTLPISHQADVDLVGEIATWVGGVVAHKTWRRLRLDVGALAARSELEVRTRADAQMEFGLIVQPLRTVSRYRIGLYRFFAVPAVQLSDHFLVEYQVAQYLVDITDRERPGAQVERDEETRGGFVQMLTLKYKL